jgi:hypothetical protein
VVLISQQVAIRAQSIEAKRTLKSQILLYGQILTSVEIVLECGLGIRLRNEKSVSRKMISIHIFNYSINFLCGASLSSLLETNFISISIVFNFH